LQDSSDLNSVKICDFGLSGQFDNVHQMYNVNTFAEFCGTRIYMAPEIFENKSYGKVLKPYSVNFRPLISGVRVSFSTCYFPRDNILSTDLGIPVINTKKSFLTQFGTFQPLSISNILYIP
jgi:serine/threonine protein kinase